MGACCDDGLTPEERQLLKEERLKSKRIEENQRMADATSSEYIKLLLLGAGESGKSTLFKQMIALYGKGYSEDERKKFIGIIQQNVVSAMQMLVQRSNIPGLEVPAIDDNADDEFLDKFGTVSEANQEHAKHFMELPSDFGMFSDREAEGVEALWKDPGIQQTFDNRAQFQFPDSAPYYFNKVMQIADASYIPDQQDILRARVRTTGIVEQNFEISGKTFVMYDVGGQRNERKKWIHCFENVTSIIFVAAISEYDQVLFEDETTNRMIEALDLFEEIVNSPWFKETSVILFLNKRDLFEKKIETVPLTKCFPEYTGPQTYKHGCQFITKMFLNKNQNEDKEIYSHVTCATSTQNIKHVFNSVQDTILRGHLRNAGLM